MGAMSGPQVHTDTPEAVPVAQGLGGRQLLLARAPFLAPHQCAQESPQAEPARQLLQRAFDVFIKAGSAVDAAWRAGLLKATNGNVDNVGAGMDTGAKVVAGVPVVGALGAAALKALSALGQATAAQSTAAPITFAQSMAQTSYRGFAWYPTCLIAGGWGRWEGLSAEQKTQALADFTAAVDARLAAYGQLFGVDLLCCFPRWLDQPGRTISDWDEPTLQRALSAAQLQSQLDQLGDAGRAALLAFTLDSAGSGKYLLEALPDPAGIDWGGLAQQGAAGLVAFLQQAVDKASTPPTPAAPAPAAPAPAAPAPAAGAAKGATTVATTPPTAAPAAAPQDETWSQAAAAGIGRFSAWLKRAISGRAAPGAAPTPAAPAASPAPAPVPTPAPSALPVAPTPAPATPAATAAADAAAKAITGGSKTAAKPATPTDTTTAAITAGLGLAKGILDVVKQFASDDGKGKSAAGKSAGQIKIDLPEVDDTETFDV